MQRQVLTPLEHKHRPAKAAHSAAVDGRFPAAAMHAAKSSRWAVSSPHLGFLTKQCSASMHGNRGLDTISDQVESHKPLASVTLTAAQ